MSDVDDLFANVLGTPEEQPIQPQAEAAGTTPSTLLPEAPVSTDDVFAQVLQDPLQEPAVDSAPTASLVGGPEPIPEFTPEQLQPIPIADENTRILAAAVPVDPMDVFFDSVLNAPKAPDIVNEVNEPHEVNFWESVKRSSVSLEKMIAGSFELVEEQMKLQNNPLMMVGAATLLGKDPSTLEVMGAYNDATSTLTGASERMKRHAEKRLLNYQPPVQIIREGETFWDALTDPARSQDLIIQSMGENAMPTIAGMMIAGTTSGTAFLVGGAEAALATAGRTALAYTMSVEGGSSFNDLVALGVDRKSASDTASFVGMINGLLETLPWAATISNVPAIKKLLKSDMSEQLLESPQLRTRMLGILKISGLEGVTEALQEFVANTGKRIYDASQSLFEGMGESAFLGFLMGGTYSTSVEIIVESITQANKLAKKFKKPEELLALRSSMQDVEDARIALEQELQKVIDTAAQPLEGQAIGPEDAAGVLPGHEAKLDVVHQTVPVKDANGDYTTLEHVVHKPGKVLKGAFGQNEQKRLRDIEATIEELFEQAEMTGAMGGSLQEAFERLNGDRERIATLLQNLPNIQHAIVRTLTNYMETYLPDYMGVVGDGTNWRTLEQKDGTVAAPFAGANFIDPKRKIIYMDLNVVSEMLLTPDKQSMKISRFPALIGHEFGHMLKRHYFNQAPKPVQQALFDQYLSDKEAIMGATLQEFSQIYGAAGQASRFAQMTAFEQNTMTIRQAIGEGGPIAPQDLQELLTFDEWFAQQMAKRTTQQPKGLARMFDKTRKALERYHRRFGKDFGATESFEHYLNSLGKQVELDAVQKRVEGITPENVTMADEEVLLEQDLEAQGDLFEQVWGDEQDQRPAGDWLGPMIPQEAKVLDEYRTDFSLFKKFMLTLEQAGYRNEHIFGLLRDRKNGDPGFINSVIEYSKTIHGYEERVDQGLKQWRQLGPKQGQTLSRLALEANRISYEQGRKLTTPELVHLAEQIDPNVEQRTFEFYQELQEEFDSNLDAMELSLVAQAERTSDMATQEGVDSFNTTIDRIKQQTQAAKQRNYFPVSRFGKFTMTVKAQKATTYKGKDYAKGDIVQFETFETKKDATKLQKQMRRSFPSVFSVNEGILTAHEKDYLGLPIPLLEALREIVPAERKTELDDAIRRSLPGQGFAKRQLGFKGVKGWSWDGARSYAAYTSSFGRYLAKVEQTDVMDGAIGEVEGSLKELEANDVDTSSRKHLVEMMKHQREYIVNPKSELQWLSAVAFNWYLAAVPMKVVLNLLQLPTVVFPYLSHRYGAAKSMAAMNHAQSLLVQMRKNPEQVPDHYHAMMQRLQQEGKTSQSMANEIAGVESGGPMQHAIPSTELRGRARNAFRQITVLGGYLWHHTEGWARETTALAIYDMEIKNDSSPDEAYHAARQGVSQAMFEYARWNRPRFQQGNLRPLTIFFTHIQHMIEHVMGPHPEKWRTMGMLLLIGGVQGMPFVEDAEELMTAFFRFVNKKYGREIFPNDSRLALRELVQEMAVELTDDPETLLADLAMRGASRYSLGLSEIGKMAHETMVPWDLPISTEWLSKIPEVDLHSSVSLGKIIPGLDSINAEDYNSFTQRAGTSLAGAGFGIPLAITKAFFDTSATDLSRLRTMAPAAISHPLKAWEYLSTQEATDPKGNVLARFDLENQTEWNEIVAQSLGGNITRINLEKEARWAFKSQRIYYQRRRREFYKLLTDAVEVGDKEQIKDAQMRIKRWNSSVHPDLRITNKALSGAVEGRLGAKARASIGLPPSDTDIPLKRRVDTIFPRPSGLASPAGSPTQSLFDLQPQGSDQSSER